MAVLRRRTGGEWETVEHDPQLLWPDTMPIATDGFLLRHGKPVASPGALPRREGSAAQTVCAFSRADRGSARPAEVIDGLKPWHLFYRE
jgi:hypothetical protein